MLQSLVNYRLWQLKHTNKSLVRIISLDHAYDHLVHFLSSKLLQVNIWSKVWPFQKHFYIFINSLLTFVSMGSVSQLLRILLHHRERSSPGINLCSRKHRLRVASVSSSSYMLRSLQQQWVISCSVYLFTMGQSGCVSQFLHSVDGYLYNIAKFMAEEKRIQLYIYTHIWFHLEML